MKPYIIGIGGGTSSGKTTVAKAIVDKLGSNNITYISYDNYYKDLSYLAVESRNAINFDHPNSLDTILLIKHIETLINGKSIETPKYDFITHTRCEKKGKLLNPKKIILIEGILALHDYKLQKLMDIKIFVDTSPDERLIRRLDRDIKTRGRDYSSVIKQYQTTVKPMHLQFIQPTKEYADIIIPSGYNKAAVDIVINGLLKICDFKLINNNK